MSSARLLIQPQKFSSGKFCHRATASPAFFRGTKDKEIGVFLQEIKHEVLE
jgi:hypothetical protein